MGFGLMPDWENIERGRRAAQERAAAARAAQPQSEDIQEESPADFTYTAGGAIQLFTPTPTPEPDPVPEPKQEKNWFEQATDAIKSAFGINDEPSQENIAAEQRELSAMGLYAGEGHGYYADGIAGDVTEHARKLRDDEDYGLRYLEERLSNEGFLGSISDGRHEKEVLMLEAAINRSRTLQGLGPLPVDGVLDADMLVAIEQYKNDYEVEEKDLIGKAVEFVQGIITPSAALQVQEREVARQHQSDTPMNDRQERVTGIMGAAAERFNIPPELMVGIWHHETSFSCSAMTSTTGCQGDWQFERATMRNVVRLYGDDMEAVLREEGQGEMANAVADIQRRLLHGQSVSAAELDAFRNSPEISTVAAAALMRDNAGSLRLGNTIEQSEFGIIYAGYNGGLENARAMRDGGVITNTDFLSSNTVGRVARTHEAQRAHYDGAIREGIEEGGSLIAAARDGSTGRDASVQVAESFQAPATIRNEGPAGTAERVQLSSRFGAATENIDFGKMVGDLVNEGIQNVQGLIRQVTGGTPNLTA